MSYRDRKQGGGRHEDRSRSGSRYGGRGGRGGGSRGRREMEERRKPSDRAIMLTNAFELIIEDVTWLQYGIDWGGAENRRTRLRIYREFIKLLTSAEERKYCVFDGTTIYTLMEFEKAKDMGEVIVSAYGLQYTIKITGVNKVTSIDSLLQVYNILLKQIFKLNPDFMEIRKRHFEKIPLTLNDPSIAEKIRVYPGYHTQVGYKRFGDKNIFVVTVDVIHKILSNESVLQILRKIEGREGWNRSSKNKARKALVKKVIFTHYNTKSYTIENIDFEKSPKDEFKFTNLKTGESKMVSYIEYYQAVYNIKIADPNQPLIKASGRGMQTIYLIPELSITTEITPEAKRLLPKTCSVKPMDRVPRISKLPSLFRANNERTKELFERFKFKVGDTMLPVKYKVFEKPRISMPGVSPQVYNRQWGAELRNINYGVDDPHELMAFVTHTKYDHNFAEDISESVMREFKKIKAAYSIRGIIKVEVRDSHLDALTRHPDWKRYSQNNNNVVIFSVIQDDRRGTEGYKELKEYCDREGFIHQAVNSRNFAKSKNRGVILGNIARQVLNKKDELCYKIAIDKEAPFLTGRSVLLIGIDIYHSTVEYDEAHTIYFRRRSIKAFVGHAIHPSGKYKTFNHYVSRTGGAEVLCSESDGSSVMSGEQPQSKIVKEQGQGEEGPVLGDFIRKICKKLNMEKFDLIVIYRDGVADSQIEFILNEEVEDVRQSAPKSKLAFFVVQKDIKQKYFLQDDEHYFNTESGTIIDDDGVNVQPEDQSIRRSHPRDFYLTSVMTNLSTNRPVRLLALYLDDVCTKDNNYTELQKLTHALCFMYPNWPDSIKVPFVTQMAHKLAYHIGELGSKEPDIHDDLFNSIFYL